MITGPSDPPDLVILEARSDRKTQDIGFARSQWVSRWRDIDRFFGLDGQARETLDEPGTR
jgi:hypothetical protein